MVAADGAHQLNVFELNCLFYLPLNTNSSGLGPFGSIVCNRDRKESLDHGQQNCPPISQVTKCALPL